MMWIPCRAPHYGLVQSSEGMAEAGSIRQIRGLPKWFQGGPSTSPSLRFSPCKKGPSCFQCACETLLAWPESLEKQHIFSIPVFSNRCVQNPSLLSSKFQDQLLTSTPHPTPALNQYIPLGGLLHSLGSHIPPTSCPNQTWPSTSWPTILIWCEEILGVWDLDHLVRHLCWTFLVISLSLAGFL